MGIAVREFNGLNSCRAHKCSTANVYKCVSILFNIVTLVQSWSHACSEPEWCGSIWQGEGRNFQLKFIIRPFLLSLVRQVSGCLLPLRAINDSELDLLKSTLLQAPSWKSGLTLPTGLQCSKTGKITISFEHHVDFSENESGRCCLFSTIKIKNQRRSGIRV